MQPRLYRAFLLHCFVDSVCRVGNPGSPGPRFPLIHTTCMRRGDYT